MPTETKNQEEELRVHEQPDGSVLVGGQPAPASEHDEDEDEDRPVTGGAETEAEATELAAATNDEEREAIRARRRQERKDKKQRALDRESELKARLERAENENRQLNERLGLIERKTTGSELAQLDGAIQHAEREYGAAKAQMEDAISRQDGAGVTQATERMVVSRERHAQLTGIRQSLTAAPARQQSQLDPQLKRHAESWLSRNPWYDPKGSDVDSRLTLVLDQALAQEGYAPNTAEYWEELDKRVGKYLPHRAASRDDPEQGIVGGTDPAGRKKPSKNVVTGSGRESAVGAVGGQFTLSAARVQALKDAGMWEDPVQRNAMIRHYRDYDRKHLGKS